MEVMFRLNGVLSSPVGEFTGMNGFLGTRGSFMMDLVVLAMVLVLVLLAVSVRLVKQGKFAGHKKLQLVLGMTLLVAVAAFEVDIQFVSKWRERAEPSPYFEAIRAWSCPAGVALMVHLCFAVPTALLWVVVITRALRQFPRPPQPGPHSAAHRLWGWLGTGGMLMTAVTGWVFYWLAFVAR